MPYNVVEGNIRGIYKDIVLWAIQLAGFLCVTLFFILSHLLILFGLRWVNCQPEPELAASIPVMSLKKMRVLHYIKSQPLAMYKKQK